MNLPAFYNPSLIGKVYDPRRELVTKEAEKARKLNRPKAESRRALLVVDGLNDFLSKKKGALYVPNSEQSQRFVIEYLLINPYNIEELILTNDEHPVNHIASPIPWSDKNGDMPICEPVCAISFEEAMSEKYRYLPNPAYGKAYIKRQEDNGYGPLLVFKPHALYGTPGANLSPALFEAILYWSVLTGRDAKPFPKANTKYSEQFGAIENTIGDVLGSEVLRLVGEILRSDIRLKIGGWAGDYCLKWLMIQLMKYMDSKSLEQIDYMRDWTALINPRDSEYGQHLAQMESRGIRVVN